MGFMSYAPPSHPISDKIFALETVYFFPHRVNFAVHKYPVVKLQFQLGFILNN